MIFLKKKNRLSWECFHAFASPTSWRRTGVDAGCNPADCRLPLDTGQHECRRCPVLQPEGQRRTKSVALSVPDGALCGGCRCRNLRMGMPPRVAWLYLRQRVSMMRWRWSKSLKNTTLGVKKRINYQRNVEKHRSRALWSFPNKYRQTSRPERESGCWLLQSKDWLLQPGSYRSPVSQYRKESCCTRSQRKWIFRTVPQGGHRR